MTKENRLKPKRKTNRSQLKRCDERDGELFSNKEAKRKIGGKNEDGKGITESGAGAQVTFDVKRNNMLANTYRKSSYMNTTKICTGKCNGSEGEWTNR